MLARLGVGGVQLVALEREQVALAAAVLGRIEQRANRYRAYVPDLPGCTATGASLEEVEVSIRLAIQYHILDLKGDGAVVPPPVSRVNYVAVSA